MIIKALRKQFLTGISVILPAVLTFYIGLIIFRALGKILFPVIVKIPVLQNLPYLITHIISIIAILVIVWLVGVIAMNYIGKRFLKITETIMLKAPILNHIYEGLRQVVQTIAVSKTAFQRVVMIEYPRKGIHSLAFVTNVMGDSKPKLSLFVPTTPNPTSGLYIIIPEEDTIPLNLSIEEGMKLIASAGIVTPKEVKEKIIKGKGN